MRINREQTPQTKQKISDAMKKKHQERGEEAKQQTAEKQSDSMKNYWRSIPTADQNTSKTNGNP